MKRRLDLYQRNSLPIAVEICKEEWQKRKMRGPVDRRIDESVTLDERAGRKRRIRLFRVLVSGWLALMAALVLEPCCDTVAAAPAESHAADPHEHGEHPPAPCDPWFAQHLDLNGPMSVPLTGGPDIKTLIFLAAAPPVVTARPLRIPAPVRGPDPPRPIYLTLLRLLI